MKNSIKNIKNHSKKVKDVFNTLVNSMDIDEIKNISVSLIEKSLDKIDKNLKG